MAIWEKIHLLGASKAARFRQISSGKNQSFSVCESMAALMNQWLFHLPISCLGGQVVLTHDVDNREGTTLPIGLAGYRNVVSILYQDLSEVLVLELPNLP